ncbi:MAG: response regulator [Alphaproteobacteria bacterium]
MKVLVVEDNKTLARGISQLLRIDGYVVDWVGDGMEADAALSTFDYDIVVLDLNLPGMDGFEILRRARARGLAASVLILTARDGLDDRVRGLDLGADDYMAKPFEVAELAARIRALARRRAGLHTSTIAIGALSFDLKGRRVEISGHSVEIPSRELSLLEMLVLNAGKVVAKSRLVESIASFDEAVSDNAVEQYVSRLRRRISPAGLTIKVARGLGYILSEPDQR